MVDSLKGVLPAKGDSSVSDTQSLRNNFKNLTSSLKVVSSSADDSLSLAEVSNGAADKGSEVLQNLNDAVSFSRLALQSLEQITSAADDGGTQVQAVIPFADELSKLKDDISHFLNELQGKAVTADVIQANIAASNVNLKDVEAAQTQARKTGDQITFNEVQAHEAHSSLSPAKVAELLKE